MVRLAVLASTVVACYQPAREIECALACVTGEDCPSNLVCARGRCAATPDACDTGGVDGNTDGTGLICAGDPLGLDPGRCFAPPGEMVFATDFVLDTDLSELCDKTIATACYVVGGPITVTATIGVTGSRPLVFWSASNLEVSGTIDAGSKGGGTSGPAANDPSCEVVDGAVQNGMVPQFGAGGAGGSYQRRGGGGGRGGLGVNQIGPTAVGGVAAVGLRGGCPGGSGGGSLANAGAGGGALYLMAVETIRITGIVNVSGAGGGGGLFVQATRRGGGGGGGSGGMVGFDGKLVVFDGARISALGGGGGSGANDSNQGNKGQEPNFVFVVPAGGGPATVSNNHGGAGSNLTSSSVGLSGGEVESGQTGGGGGGGGGPGFVLQFGAVQPGSAVNTIAPPL